MQNSKLLGFPLTAVLAVGALLGSAGDASGQSSCVALSAVNHATSPVDIWLGEGWWAFGNAAPIHAKETTGSTVYEKSDGDVWYGTEKTTVDFGNGNTFQLTTRWLAHHNSTGIGEVTETGTIGNGTGKFADIIGVFYAPGTFGFMWGDQVNFLWLGSRQGTVCGLNSSMTTATQEMEAPFQTQPQAIRRVR